MALAGRADPEVAVAATPTTFAADSGALDLDDWLCLYAAGGGLGLGVALFLSASQAPALRSASVADR